MFLAPEVEHLLFNLVLLPQQVLLHLVDPHVEPLDVHLGLLAAVLAPLQLVDQLQDLRLNRGVRLGARVSKRCRRAAERHSIQNPQARLGNILDSFGTFWTIIYAILSSFTIYFESRTLNSVQEPTS